MKFHRRCGDRVTLLHDNTTAVRNFVEFNHGLILSAEPLPDDVIFEVCIDRKVNVWNGSLEIGVTTNDPEYMELPATATKLRNTAWIMSGCSIVKDGVTLINEYGPELDSLHEGEILGVMKSSKGDLSFYVNGRCLGVAAEDIPERVFAVIDLYGQCVQVTIVSPNYRRLQDPSMESLSEDLAITDDHGIDLTLPSTSQAPPGFRQDLHLPLPELESGCLLESGEAPLLNSGWTEGEQNRANSESSGSGDPDQDVMSDREDEDSREDRYDSIARGVRDPHLDSNLTAVRNRVPESAAGGRCRVGMLYDWHLDQLTPYTGDANPASQYDNSLSEVSEAGLTSEESEAVVYEVRTVENRIVETIITMPDDDNDIVAQDRLRFHPRCGVLVKISSNYRTAERSRPLDDYNNGVVMTHRPLRDNELFEIRIDKLVDKWSGSIEMGVTHHNPATIRYPSTMTNMDSGTIMMSGCKVLLNGQGTCLEYGNMNLDELREGDRVGVVRKASGQLHYVINGADQGVAAERVQPPVWGVVDLYGMTVKVTIQDTSLNELSPDSNMVDRSLPIITPLEEEPDISGVSNSGPRIDEESLLFHTLRDSHVTIINDGKTAHRPNAFEYFNNGVVTTNRTLRTNELFQVRLDLVIPKWAGSVEIGVTQHSSGDLKFPYRVTNIKTGTWVLAGEDVIQNGNVIIPKYVRNLSRLKEGDTVGVVRRDDGILHFYVNGVDQGPAACNVPEHVFGIVDLYGRVAQVTMVDCHRPPLAAPFSPESPGSTESNATVYPEMCFHRVHGRNARLSRTRLTASRTAVYSEFNDAVLFSSRPLRECDMFELRIDAMVDCWIGSLEIGVTAIRPEDLETNGSIGSLAGTATDLNYDTYILSGAAMMKDGECVKSGYALDLDTLTVGSRVGLVEEPDFATFFLSGEALMKNGHCFGTYPLNLSKLQVGNRIGMMWHADRYLHYYLDGMDMGKAWYVPHLNIHAVVDLYGQCTQVTILQNEERAFNYNGRSNSDSLISSNGIKTTVTPQPPYWSFSEYCGDNVSLSQELCVAKRLTADPMGGLVFSSSHLAVGEIFEIKILQCQHNYAGNLRMGVTDVDILNAHVNRHMPPSANFLPHYTAYIDGRYIRYSKPGSREQDLRAVVPSFEWLRPGDRVGFKKTAEGQVLVYVNGDQLDACFEAVPDKVYVVMELYGRTTKIQAVTKGPNVISTLQPTIANDGYASHQDIESEAIRELLNINSEDQQDEEMVWPTGILTLAEPEEASETDEIIQPEASEGEDNEGNLVVPAPPGPVPEPVGEEMPELPMVFPEIQNVRKRAFTFHSVHGRNIELLASETVACRTRSYDHGIAVISKPLRRGESITFRVDKLDRGFVGSLSVGVVPYLPVDPLPEKAIHLSHPAWVAEAEFVLRDNLSYRYWESAHELDTLEEGHAVSILFDEQGQLWIDINRKNALYSESKTLTIFGKTDEFFELYPLVDVYGRVTQVSAIIHSNYVTLAKYTTYRHTLYKPTVVDDIYNIADIRRLVRGFMTTKWPHCAYYTEMLKEFQRYNKLKAIAIRVELTEDQEYFLDAWKRSHSTQHLPSLSDDYSDTSLMPDSDSSEFEDLEAWRLEADRREANRLEADRLEAERLKADRLEAERRQADRQAATRELVARIQYALDCRDAELTSPIHTEILSEFLQVSHELEENARTHGMEEIRLKSNYLKQILSVNQEGETSTEAEVVSKEDCEVLQLALNYWLTQLESYPEIRRAVACGQVKCFCRNCEPNNTDAFITGWVRIERIEGVGAASKRYWHLTRNGMGLALVREAREEVTRRPTALVAQPNCDLPAFDMWTHGNNNYIVSLAVEIDTEGPPANDRVLAVMLNVRPDVATSSSEVTSAS